MGTFECVKCGTPDPKIKWVEPIVDFDSQARPVDGRCMGTEASAYGCALRGEHFHCTCKKCGYPWTSKDLPRAKEGE